MIVLRTANALLAALLAPPCAACGRVLDTPLAGAVCQSCWRRLHPQPSSFELPGITCARALGPYEGLLRELLHALKYDGRRTIAPPLSSLMSAHAADVLRDVDCVVPVPLHRRRQRERGFNQAEELARGLDRPVVRLLRRRRATRAQVGLAAEARRENVRDAFALRSWPLGQASRVLPSKVVVLVDDVATTGATLAACAAALRRAGAAEVRALTVARVASGPR